MVAPASLEAEHSPHSTGSLGSTDGRRSSGQHSHSFRRRSSRSGRSSRDGGFDVDDWGYGPRQRAEAIEKLQAELRAISQYSNTEFDHHTLLRFLKARDYDIPKALEMYLNHLKWRRENGIDTILTDFDFTEREAFLGVYPQGYHKTDKMGRPITIQHLGSIDLKRIMEVTTMERMLKFHIQEYERFLKCITPVCSRVAGRHIDQTFAILDVKGVSLKMLTGDVRKMLGDMTKIDSDHYPETLGKTCIINVPFVFKAVWALVKPMLQPRTQSKITLVGTKYMDELLKYIDIENIPEYLGGKSKNSLIDDAGPWNDPMVLSSLNKIAEDGFSDEAQLSRPSHALRAASAREPAPTTIRVLNSPLEDDARSRRSLASPRAGTPVGLDVGGLSPLHAPHLPYPPAAAGMLLHSPGSSQASPGLPAGKAFDGSPQHSHALGSTPLLERVRTLERLIRERGGPSLNVVPGPTSSTILARVEFLEKTMELVVSAQETALAEAREQAHVAETSLREREHELATLRAQQEEDERPNQSRCCCIM